MDSRLADGTDNSGEVGTTGGLFFAGEVRSSGKAFTEEQVGADVGHSVALGVDLHLMACVDDMPVDAVRLVAELCASSSIGLQIPDRRYGPRQRPHRAPTLLHASAEW